MREPANIPEMKPSGPLPKTDSPSAEGEGSAGRKVIVREGDSLEKLAKSVYGRMDEGILNLLKKNNPDIKNINRLRVGQEIHFPPAPDRNPGG